MCWAINGVDKNRNISLVIYVKNFFHVATQLSGHKYVLFGHNYLVSRTVDISFDLGFSISHSIAV